MEYTNSLRTALGSLYGSYSNISGGSINSNYVNYTEHNVFNMFMRVDISSPIIELPVFCRRIFEDYAVGSIVTKHRRAQGLVDETEIYDEIVLPMYANYTVNKRTSDSTLKSLFRGSADDRLICVKTHRGEKYYGNKGFILDSNKRVILMCSIVGEPDDTTGRINITDVRLYINPKVFLSDGLIEKHIVKKVLPYFVENGVVIPTRGRTVNRWNGMSGYFEEARNVHLVLEDCTDKFFVTPTVGTPSLLDSTKINQFLTENLDKVIKSSSQL